MKFGIGIPTCREGLTLPAPFASPSQIVELTKKAEKLGYDSVWADDHIMVTEGMHIGSKVPPNWYDPLITLGAAASATSKIRLCVGVICIPFRNPIILAKQAVTIDHISNGRFGLGFGLGRRDEYEHFNSESAKVHRGRLALETMESIYKLFTQDHVTFEGEYIKFRDVSLYPKPVQNPPAIYVAGETEDTSNRVANWATGQLMSMLSSSRPIPERLELLKKSLEEHGRKFSDIDKTVVIAQNVNKSHEKAVEAFKKSVIGTHVKPERLAKVVADNAIGTPEEVAEKVLKTFAMGIDSYTIHHYAVQSLQELEEQVQIFAEDVMPLVKKASQKAKK